MKRQIKKGTFVTDHFNRKGIVYKVDEHCVNDVNWLALQKHLKPEDREEGTRWFGILVDGNGAVYIPETKLQVIPAFAIQNFAIDLYHPELRKFIPNA